MTVMQIGDANLPCVLAFAGAGMRADGFTDRSGLAEYCLSVGWSYYCPESPGPTWRNANLREAQSIMDDTRRETGSSGPMFVVGHSAGATFASRFVSVISGGVSGLVFYSGTWTGTIWRWFWPSPVAESIARVVVAWDGEERPWARREAIKAADAYRDAGSNVSEVVGNLGRHGWDRGRNEDIFRRLRGRVVA